jgi:hypothetical protein
MEAALLTRFRWSSMEVHAAVEVLFQTIFIFLILETETLLPSG